MLVRVYTCQNVKLLRISCSGSYKLKQLIQYYHQKLGPPLEDLRIVQILDQKSI